MERLRQGQQNQTEFSVLGVSDDGKIFPTFDVKVKVTGVRKFTGARKLSDIAPYARSIGFEMVNGSEWCCCIFIFVYFKFVCSENFLRYDHLVVST